MLKVSHLIRCLFYTKLSQSHSVGHRPGRFNDVKRRQVCKRPGSRDAHHSLQILCKKRWKTVGDSCKSQACLRFLQAEWGCFGGWVRRQSENVFWRWQRETQESSCPTGRVGTFIIWTWPMEGDRLLAITLSSGSCLYVPRLHHSLCQSRLAWLNIPDEKMAGLEGSSLWAVRVGPFTPGSAWGSCGEDDP